MMRVAMLVPFAVLLLSTPGLGQPPAGEGGTEGGNKDVIGLSGGALLELSDVRLPLEVADVDAVDDDGVTRIDPLSPSAANRGVDYFTRETFFGIRGVLEVRLPGGFSAGGFLRLGFLTLDLTNEIDPGSVFVGTNGDPRNQTATSWGEFAFGFGLRGTLAIDGFRASLAWQFDWGAGRFEDQFFFNDRVDGRYHRLSNRFTGQLGYDLDFVVPCAVLGILFYDGNADLEEANEDTPRTYEIGFGARDVFCLGLGADFLAGEHVFARVNLLFLAETALEFTVGLRFS